MGIYGLVEGEMLMMIMLIVALRRRLGGRHVCEIVKLVCSGSVICLKIE